MNRVNQIVFFFVTLGLISLPHSTEAIDTIIKNAEADIARFEQQAQGLTAARSSNARRILKLLNLSHERLQNSKNQTDVSWQDVNQRYIALKTQLEGLLEPAKAEANDGQSTTTQPEQTVGQENSSTQSNDAVPALVSGERVRVKKLARDIESVRNGLSTTGPSSLQDQNEVAAYQKGMQRFLQNLTALRNSWLN